MKLGHHFGKRKPRWNFFTDHYQNLVGSTSNLIVKLLLASIVIQLAFFLPVLYWVFQNYSIIQSLIPTNFNMAENLEFEKKWIVFLVLSSTVAASVWNAFLWLYVYKNTMLKLNMTSDSVALPVAADDQRLAS